MKVSFSVLERLLILNVLPGENNIVTLKVIRKIKDQIGFNDEELKLLEFKTIESNGKSNTQWKNGAVGDREFELSEKAVDIISAELKKMNEQKKLTESHLSVYDKVVGDVC